MLRRFPLLPDDMRAVLLLAFALLGCATDIAGGNVELRTIATGSYAAAEPQAPKAVAIVSAGDYARVWEQTIGGGERPPVDFAKESVVILLAGSRPTGGYRVAPRSARIEGKTLIVDAAIEAPPRDAIVTQAFTSPYAVIAVTAKPFTDVRWTP